MYHELLKPILFYRGDTLDLVDDTETDQVHSDDEQPENDEGERK